MRGAFLALFLILPLALWGQRLSIGPVMVPPEGEVVKGLTGPYIHVGPVEPGAEGLLRELLFVKFSELGYRVMPLEEGEGEDPVEAALSLAKAQGAEYALAAVLYRWSEREGGSLGVMRPAEVAFEVLLLRVEDGRPLWGRLLRERQRSLSEDLLKLPRFLRKGPRWLTARELAEALLEEALR